MTTYLLAVLLVSAGIVPTASSKLPLDTAKIEELTGAKGSFDAKEGTFKVSVPRDDLSVVAAGIKLTPPMGLTSWAAFKKAGAHTVVMGDTVLLEDQVNPVMSVALDNGLEVTALHNHFFWDAPRVMFMHIGGMGDEAALAAAVGKVFAKIKDTSGGKRETPHADIDPASTTLDPKKIDAIFGKAGDFKNGVYKATFGRETKMHGEPMGNAMGVNTWAAFAAAMTRRSSTATSRCSNQSCKAYSRRSAEPASTSSPFTSTCPARPRACSSCITGASVRRRIWRKA